MYIYIYNNSVTGLFPLFTDLSLSPRVSHIQAFFLVSCIGLFSHKLGHFAFHTCWSLCVAPEGSTHNSSADIVEFVVLFLHI